MKVRNGFVSNSSSSSFVVLGVRYDGDDKYDLVEQHDLHSVSDTDIVGVYYFGADDYGTDEQDVSPEEIQKDFDRLREIFGEDAKIRWFSGMEYC